MKSKEFRGLSSGDFQAVRGASPAGQVATLAKRELSGSGALGALRVARRPRLDGLALAGWPGNSRSLDFLGFLEFFLF